MANGRKARFVAAAEAEVRQFRGSGLGKLQNDLELLLRPVAPEGSAPLEGPPRMPIRVIGTRPDGARDQLSLLFAVVQENGETVLVLAVCAGPPTQVAEEHWERAAQRHAAEGY